MKKIKEQIESKEQFNDIQTVLYLVLFLFNVEII